MYILFDIGGTNMRLAVSKDGKTMSQPVSVPTNPDSFAESMSDFVTAAKKLAGDTVITAIAGGIPGPMNKAKTMVLTAPNLEDWNNKPFTETLTKELGAPTYLENDTAIIGLGEAHHGAGKGKDIVVYMTISTGVGGSRIVDGKIDRNAMGFEPGHQIIDLDGEVCNCGGKGHLEGFISGRGLERIHGKPTGEIDDPDLWEKAAYHLAAGLTNVFSFWSPDIVILGGSVMQKIDIDKVRAYADEFNEIYSTLPPIEHYALGETAGLLGALEYAKQQN